MTSRKIVFGMDMGSEDEKLEDAELLDPLPALGLHLDIGHANLEVEQNTAIAILATHGRRLRHVHLHDNKGGWADLHLPLGVGTMDVAKYVTALKRSGYDGTITLEVFTRDRHYFTHAGCVAKDVGRDTPIRYRPKKHQAEGLKSREMFRL